MSSLEERVPAALAGERVDRVVATVTGLSRSSVARLIDDGAVLLDGVRVDVPSTRVSEGQDLTVAVTEPDDPRLLADPTISVPIVHVDDEIIVVEKPTGMVVHPGAGHQARTMVSGLLARFPELAGVGDPVRPGIVHRLDRGTSGLLVVARTPAAYQNLVEQMQHHQPERVYTALAWGHPATGSGTIEAPVGRSGRHPTRMTVTRQGRAAVTHYEVVHRFERPRPTALLRCRLETGRTHQIRVHLRAIHHPVVGDREYDGDRPGIELDRPFLHAGRLSFLHPATTERVTFETALPPELEAVLETLR